MDRMGNLFGTLGVTLPEIKPLQRAQMPQTRPQEAIPMPPPAPPPLPAPQPSEFSQLMGGLSGLAKQWREDVEKKAGPPGTILNLAEAIAELKAERAKIADTAAKQAGQQGADMDDYMARNAQFESGNNAAAVNPTSGASGTFQFLPSTWRWVMREAPDLGLTEEGIKDDAQQRKAMKFYTDKSRAILNPLLGRAPTGGELYLLHLLGHSGGPMVLNNMNLPLTRSISESAYKANPFLAQYKTGTDLVAGLNKIFGGA